MNSPNNFPDHEIDSRLLDLRALFDETWHSIDVVRADPEFLAYIGDIEPQEPQYWTAMAEFAYTRGDAIAQEGNYAARTALWELVVSAPDALLHRESRTNPLVRRMKSPERKMAVARECYFNSLVRYVAERYPDQLSAGELVEHLSGAVATIDYSAMTTGVAKKYFGTVVRGAQRECAFAQLLRELSANFQHASLEEDLREIDFVIAGQYGLDLCVDIVREGSLSGPYVLRYGHIVMASPVTPGELGGRFFLQDRQLLQAKAEQVRDMLNQIDNALYKRG